MDTRSMSQKGLYVGTGMGIILFAIGGLFVGSMIGGAVGLKMSELFFGGPVEAAILPRLIVAASMILGVVVSAVVCLLGTGLAGWTAGVAIDVVRHGRHTELGAEPSSVKQHR